MTQPVSSRCLILACGNTLRGDDGIGPWLADWAFERYETELAVRVINRLQWTLELAEDVARAQSVLFIDCAVNVEPGSVQLTEIAAAEGRQGIDTHHQGAEELLALGVQLYGTAPHSAYLLTVGAGAVELGEGFSEVAAAALPVACRRIESWVAEALEAVV